MATITAERSERDVSAITDGDEEQPRIKIRPARPWGSLLNLAEVWEFRDLLLALATRDVKLRYRQTALGAAWVVVQPLIGAGIFSVVFGRVAKLPSDGVPYFLFSYAGLLAWTAFSSTLSKASGSMVGNANLISKIYFPRVILPLSTVFSTLIDFGVALVMMAVLMAVYHVTPHVGLLLMPVLLLLVLLLASGVGLIAAALAVSYRDIQYVLPVLTQFLLYGSPVAYGVSAVPAAVRPLYDLNPLAALLEAFRWSLLGTGGGPGLAARVGVAAAVSVAVFLGGVVVFRRMERRFADVI
jgi:lipopolysaccharide transport system permease protein